MFHSGIGFSNGFGQTTNKPFGNGFGNKDLGVIKGTTQTGGQGTGTSWWKGAAKDIGKRVLDGVLDKKFGTKDENSRPSKHETRVRAEPDGEVDVGGRPTGWIGNQTPSAIGANTTAGGLSPMILVVLVGVFLIARRV
jgi:hypothetical protein